MKNLSNKNWMQLAGKLVTSMALFVTMTNVNAACMWIVNQPELPETSKKLRKF